MNERERDWNENYLEKEIQKLPLRIQRDINEISFPKMKEIESSYLWGQVGSGKTIQAVFMMLSELRNEFIEKRRKKAIFISVPELLLEFKSSYNKQNKEGQLTEEEILEKYSKVDLLVLDDFGVERTTDWAFQLLYILINRRYENIKKTIFTSNYSLIQLAERLDDIRIPSRIQQMCKIIEFNGKDYRMNK